MLLSIASSKYPINFNQIINKQSSSVHKITSSMASSKIPYEGPSRHEILLLISRWNEAHHSADHITMPAQTELDIAIIKSLEKLDRERVLKDKAVDTHLDFLVKDIEAIRKVNTERDWGKVNWERVDRGIETLKNLRKLWGKRVNYVAPTLPPRKSELRGGGEAWVTQSEDRPFREAVDRVKEEQSLAEKRPREPERQSGLRGSDQKVERNSEGVLKMISQLMLSQAMEKFKEIFAGGRNQEEIDRVTVLRPEGGPDRKFDTPDKLQKLTSNVPPQRGSFYQAPLRPQITKDQHHSKASSHQLPVPANQFRPRSPVHQRPVHVTRTPNKSPDHQMQVSLITPSSQDLRKRSSHQQLRPPAPQMLHKMVSHQQLPTTTRRTEPKGPANQQNPQNQHSTPHVPRPKKKMAFYEESVEPIPPVSRARSKSPPRQQAFSHRNETRSNIPAQKGTFYQQPTEANNMKDPTKDPANKVMFNKRPRVATDMKELRMQKAQEEARALASEIRKM